MNKAAEITLTDLELSEARQRRERFEYRMSQYRRFSNKRDLASYNADFGYHWFDAESKRFFNSRIDAILHGQSPASFNIFISSERYDREPRGYTIRQLQIDGQIENLSEFQQYGTAASAQRAAVRLIRASEGE